MIEPFQIRVTKANPCRAWYNSQIGGVFDVIREFDEAFYLVRTKDYYNTSNIVRKQDCEPVE